MIRNILLALIVLGLLLIGISMSGKRARPLHKDVRTMMGTFIQVTSPDRRAKDIVFTEIERIEKLIDRNNPDSEISRLNEEGRLQVSPDTMFLLEKAKEFYSLSGGAFDITIGPLLDLWGFTGQRYLQPSESEIDNKLVYVGTDKIIFHRKDNMVQYQLSGMILDLGAIAKGYAVDRAVKKLKEAGIKDCLINAGGTIYGLGNRFGKPWKVTLPAPSGGDSLPEAVELKDSALATFGNDEQFFAQGKKRFPDVFDPRTGRIVRNGLSFVTVMAPDCLTADALGITIFVLGREKGGEFAKKFPGASVRFITNKNGQ